MAAALALVAPSASAADPGSSAAALASSGSDSAAAIEARLEKRFGFKIEYRVFPADTWNSIACSPPDAHGLFAYLSLLDRELQKYPSGFFRKAGVRYLMLCEGLAFSGQERAAIPDPYAGRLYYDVSVATDEGLGDYGVLTFHHELHHYVDYAMYGDMYYRWPQWAALNVEGFEYGTGGVYAYDNQDQDWGEVDIDDPDRVPGFVSRYAALGEEEDRAEIFSYAMAGTRDEWFARLVSVDPILAAKLELLRASHERFFGAAAPEWKW
jgi:hypothetical protein